MRKTNKLSFALLCVFVFSMMWTACEMGVNKGDPEIQKPAQPITITKQPQNTTIAKSDTIINVIPLSVTAAAKDGGALNYQWYSNTSRSNMDGEAISDNASDSTYLPPFTVNTEEGEYFYYVEITNPGSSDKTTSDPVVYTITTEPKTLNNTVTVNIAEKFQYVRGFGGSMITWDNFPDDRVQDYETMCNPVDGLGLNVFRIMIPQNIVTDSTDVDEMMQILVSNGGIQSGTWWYDDHGIPPPTNAQGHTGKDQSDYYDIVKKINEHGGYVLASPWCPPWQWKKNQSIVGGPDDYLLPEHYNDFAEWLRDFGNNMANHGAPLYTISLQNEFTYMTDGYEGCQYTPTQHQTFWIREGQFFSYDPPVPGWGGGKAVSSVQTMSGEAHSTVDTAFSSVIGNTVQANQAREGINILGRHIYGSTGNSPQAFLNNAQFHPTDPKEVWQTEWSNGSPDSELTYTWNYVWVFMSVIDYTIRHNNESAFIWFPSKSFHAILGDGGDGTINGMPLPRGYGMSQYAKFAKETGRVGVNVTGDNAARVNPANFSGSNAYTNTNYLGPKITAYVTLNDDFYAGSVESRHRRWRGLDGSGLENLDVSKISAISLVMFTPTDNNGNSGVDLGTVKIQLPADFKIGTTTAMRSTDGKYCVADSGKVTIGVDGNYAFVTLPAGEVLSVRFDKAQ